MGLITSRFNLNGMHSNGGRRSNQNEEQLYSYSLNKNFFSNYFFMGGERFEVSDPDYLFGDNCDLNFLTSIKPYSLPYKKVQQNLLTNISTKQKAMNKVSSRVGSLSSPLNILTGRNRQASQSRKQDAQTQTLNNCKSNQNGPEPSQPLVMLINIRKETLRLVKSSHSCSLDSDQNSLTNTASISNTNSERSTQQSPRIQRNQQKSKIHRRHGKAQTTMLIAKDSTACNNSISPNDLGDGIDCEDIELEQTIYRSKTRQDSDTSSITSSTFSSSGSTTVSTSTGKSGYTSVREVPPSDCASEDGEYFEDALNEPTNPSTDNDSEKNQQESLLRASESTKTTCDIKITIEENNEVDRRSACDIEQNNCLRDKSQTSTHSKADLNKTMSSNILTKARDRKSPKTSADKKQSAIEHQASNRVYNIEFTFDAEVDCSIRVSYFCTRVVSSNNVTYKPLHATYKSKTYTYKRGLNQKFEQKEHSFRPYLFDEDLLIYKPLDLDGNYNSGAVFPIVIHCVALEGPMPRQSQSLVATVEKSQLDDSYSIKPLKQMIFADGVQYILQDIYGIENKPLISSNQAHQRTRRPERNLHSSCGSLYSLSNLRDNDMNLTETVSMNSVGDVGDGVGPRNSGNRGSIVSNQYRSLGSENTFECVICMSDERDTMLLPCRHMCLCSSCAQSLRFQSSSCPICRCPFKAALNIRFTRRCSNRKWSSNAADTEHKCSTDALVTTTTSDATGTKFANNKRDRGSATTRRESLTISATPLLQKSDLATKNNGRKNSQNSHNLPASMLPVEPSISEGTRIQDNTTMTDAASESANLEMKSMGGNSCGLRRCGSSIEGGAAKAED